MLSAIIIALLVTSAAAQCTASTCGSCIVNPSCTWCSTPQGGVSNAEVENSGVCGSSFLCDNKMSFSNRNSSNLKFQSVCLGTPEEAICSTSSSLCSCVLTTSSNAAFSGCTWVQPPASTNIPAFCDMLNNYYSYPSTWTTPTTILDPAGQNCANNFINQAIGLATGAIVGIIIAGIVILVLIILGIMACCCGGIYCCVKANQAQTQGGVVLSSTPAAKGPIAL